MWKTSIRQSHPAQIRLPHLLIPQQLLAAAAQADLAVNHHIPTVSQLQRVMRILLHQKNGHPALGQFA
nr:MAG TPA: hypothetical protein [Caudoviricetes sp.]